MWLHSFGFTFVFACFEDLLLLETLFFEVETYNWWQLQRITNSYQLPTIKLTDRQQTLRLKHLWTFIQYNDLKLHLGHDSKTCWSACSSNDSLACESVNSALDLGVFYFVDWGLDAAELLVDLWWHVTRPILLQYLLLQTFKMLDSFSITSFLVIGRAKSIWNQRLVYLLNRSHTTEVIKALFLKHQKNSVDGNVGQSTD